MISETLQPIDVNIESGGVYKDLLPLGPNLFRASKNGKYFLLKTAADNSAAALEMLKREYDIARRVQHPFIVSAVGWEADTPAGPAIAFEYIQGRTLDKWLQEKPSLQERKRVFAQLLDAVSAIHRQSILHNDIKPENILVTETDNDVKLIDFGFADGDAHYMGKGLGGTRSYASPELLSHAHTDARSDIYTIGVLMQDIFPGRYGSISRKCRRQDPDRRYPSVNALRKAWHRSGRPVRWIGALLLLCAAALPVIWQQHTIRTIQNRAEAGEDALNGAIDSLTTQIDSLTRQLTSQTQQLETQTQQLDSIASINSDREKRLAKAKETVDAWYRKELPIYFELLKKASTLDEVIACSSQFEEKEKYIHFDLPAQVGEDIRPALREYILTHQHLEERSQASDQRIAELTASN